MSDLIIKKNGTDYKLPMLAEHYPADRVYLDGDTDKNVQDELDSKVTIGTTKARLCFIPIQSCTFSSGSCTKDLSSSIPSGYRISVGMAQCVDTGSVAITGCKKTPDTNTSITVKAISGGSAFSGSADINFMLMLLPIS